MSKETDSSERRKQEFREWLMRRDSEASLAEYTEFTLRHNDITPLEPPFGFASVFNQLHGIHLSHDDRRKTMKYMVYSMCNDADGMHLVHVNGLVGSGKTKVLDTFSLLLQQYNIPPEAIKRVSIDDSFKKIDTQGRSSGYFLSEYFHNASIQLKRITCLQ